MSYSKYDYRDMPGRRFGHLIAQNLVNPEVTQKSSQKWLCICDCGGQRAILARHLVNGETKTCGCGLLHRTHGHTANYALTPEYMAYNAARARCTGRSPRFKYWQDKKIEFRFKSFNEFFEHLGKKPQPRSQYSLDRIDNNGHYELGNVRWATRSQQMKNRNPWKRRTKKQIMLAKILDNTP